MSRSLQYLPLVLFTRSLLGSPPLQDPDIVKKRAAALYR